MPDEKNLRSLKSMPKKAQKLWGGHPCLAILPTTTFPVGLQNCQLLQRRATQNPEKARKPQGRSRGEANLVAQIPDMPSEARSKACNYNQTHRMAFAHFPKLVSLATFLIHEKKAQKSTSDETTEYSPHRRIPTRS
jgi:hypothetical protein